jgi:hypothetical protein
MKPIYWVTIKGNDVFYVTLKVVASNIELAMAFALRQMDKYKRDTIEQLRVVKIEEDEL